MILPGVLMTTKTIYSITALLLTTSALGLARSSGADDFPDFGVAEMRAEALVNFKKDWIREELKFLSDINPFPSGDVPRIDPISRQRVSSVSVGPALRTRAHGSDYDYYRYVTFYNVRTRRERIYEQPIMRELCHNKSGISSGVSISSNWSASVTASVSLKVLGVSGTFSKGRSYNFHQDISPTPGVIADHTAYFYKQDWVGRTHIQLLNAKTGKTEFLKKTRQEADWWVYVLFPLAARLADIGKYPMDFSIRDAERTFALERDIIGTCDDGFGT